MEKIKESIFGFIFKKRRGKSPPRFSRNKAPQNADLHPKKVTVLKVTGVELVTLFYF